MTNSLKYAFVSGVSDAIEQAWEQFQKQRLRHSLGESVRFIPAMGGCFLVLAHDAPSVNSKSFSQRLRPLAGRITVAELLEFKEAFEAGTVAPGTQAESAAI